MEALFGRAWLDYQNRKGLPGEPNADWQERDIYKWWFDRGFREGDSRTKQLEVEIRFLRSQINKLEGSKNDKRFKGTKKGGGVSFSGKKG